MILDHYEQTMGQNIKYMRLHNERAASDGLREGRQPGKWSSLALFYWFTRFFGRVSKRKSSARLFPHRVFLPEERSPFNNLVFLNITHFK